MLVKKHAVILKSFHQGVEPSASVITNMLSRETSRLVHTSISAMPHRRKLRIPHLAVGYQEGYQLEQRVLGKGIFLRLKKCKLESSLPFEMYPKQKDLLQRFTTLYLGTRTQRVRINQSTTEDNVSSGIGHASLSPGRMVRNRMILRSYAWINKST